MAVQSPKGMRDILPPDQPIWEKIRKTIKNVADFYNFFRIDTPIAESVDLFVRSVGEDSDVVEKQMFYLEGRTGSRLVLRPEGTAPVARAYIQYGLSHLSQPLKLYYEGPMFRHEQPQAGRLREFHQLGFEILSSENDPVYDAQIILAGMRFFEGLKLKDVTIVLNTIGCRTCRPNYRRHLLDYYKDKKKELCADCARRLATNPLRLLDCKEEKCRELKKEAPIMADYLCSQCSAHFKSVLEYLEELQLPYTLDHYLVRGFDYYSKTVFEYTIEGVDFVLGGGGRYDYLIESLGGKASPAVGLAIGLERVIEVLKSRQLTVKVKTKPKLYLVYIGALAKKKSLRLIEDLREAGLDVAESLGKESLKGQLRAADKAGSPLALIFGQKEAFEESVIIRDLKTGAQETVPLKKMVESVKRKMK